jgi:glycine cleavage system H protein
LEFPDDLLYTVEDAWLRIEGDEGTVGITDFAQEQLGEVVYVELPEVGKDLTGGEPFGIIESVKAVSDLHLPLGGEVTARNDALLDTPELVNSSPYGDGWMLTIRLSDPAEADGLLSAADYRAGLPEE